MLKKPPFLLFGIVILFLLGIIISTFIVKEVNNARVSGFHPTSERWSGTITVIGDTFFPPWVTLTILPCTKVFFDKSPDILDTPWTKFADAYIMDHNDPTGREGYNKTHFDLVAKIKAIGTKNAPIIFTSAQPKPEYADWDQLVVFGGSIFNYIQLSYAHNGLNVTREGFPFDLGKEVTISNSLFHDSLWSCIDTWSADVTIKNNEIYHCWHQGIGLKKEGTIIIEGNAIHDAQLSINCEGGAKPMIRKNRFEAAHLNPDCPAGEENQDIERVADTKGGTYDGKLIYPSNTQ